MRTDAIVVGAELDALTAAVRLVEHGMSVRLLATGVGSLHYAPGGLQLLGFSAIEPEALVDDPFDAIHDLGPRHPLRLIGDEAAREALDWFLNLMKQSGPVWCRDHGNKLAVTMAGAVPVLAHPPTQATLDRLTRRRVAVLVIDGHRDFVGALAVSQLQRQGIDARSVRLDLRGPTGNVSLGTALDRLDVAGEFFRDARRSLPPGTDVALFPAVLGLERHGAVCEVADDVLGVRALEVPTLPPSVPGIRLYRTLIAWLEAGGTLLHMSCRDLRAEIAGNRCLALRDDTGQRYEAAAFIAGTGGVLMGGLEVDSRGRISEPIFGLPVHQTGPLDGNGGHAVVEALHRAGIDVDSCLRPIAANGEAIDNLFITGSTLAHWNPCREASSEGVAVATGWAAAEHAAACGGS